MLVALHSTVLVLPSFHRIEVFFLNCRYCEHKLFAYKVDNLEIILWHYCEKIVKKKTDSIRNRY